MLISTLLKAMCLYGLSPLRRVDKVMMYFLCVSDRKELKHSCAGELPLINLCVCSLCSL